jgi:calcineurin-like phosphoesterase family protein
VTTTLNNPLLQLDVGVDAHDFKPISFDEIKVIMEQKKSRRLSDATAITSQHGDD